MPRELPEISVETAMKAIDIIKYNEKEGKVKASTVYFREARDQNDTGRQATEAWDILNQDREDLQKTLKSEDIAKFNENSANTQLLYLARFERALKINRGVPGPAPAPKA